MTREEAIKTLKENYCSMCAYGSCDMDNCDISYCDNREAIEVLSAVLEREKGEWIDISTGKGIFKNRSVKCSVCGNTLDLDGVNCGRGDANYCPNCGADMRGEDT